MVVRILPPSPGPRRAGPDPVLPACPHCPGEALELHQPDVQAPDRVIGHCHECGSMWRIEGDGSRALPWRPAGRVGVMAVA